MKLILNNRWTRDAVFSKMLRLKLGLEEMEPSQRRRWFDEAPHVANYATEEMQFDFRAMDLTGHKVGEVNLSSCVMDEGIFVGCHFLCTQFQESSARHANFIDSQFNAVQMSPFFAKGANFSRCTFSKSFATGHGSRNPDTGIWSYPHALSDFSQCDFGGVTAHDTYFDRCDFRGSNFSCASFCGCSFNVSDLRDVNLNGCEFVQCDFDRVSLTDTEQNRRAVESAGRNKNIDQIRWEPPEVDKLP